MSSATPCHRHLAELSQRGDIPAPGVLKGCGRPQGHLLPTARGQAQAKGCCWVKDIAGPRPAYCHHSGSGRAGNPRWDLGGAEGSAETASAKVLSRNQGFLGHLSCPGVTSMS